MNQIFRYLLPTCMATLLCIQSCPSFAVDTENGTGAAYAPEGRQATEPADMGYNASTGELTALREVD